MLQATLYLSVLSVLGQACVESLPTSTSSRGASGSSVGVTNGTTIQEFYALQAESTENCWWGTITCPSGEVCNNPVNYVGCALDVVSPIKLDDIAGAMADVVNDFTDDPVGFVVDLGVDMINQKVTDLMDCYKGLSGQAPRCSELHTLEACVNTAMTAVSAAKAASSSAMTAANLKKLNSGLGKVDKVLSRTTDMCKFGCKGGVCADADGNVAESRIYDVPAGCVCRDLEVTNEDGSTDITPTECGRNFYTQTGKVEFTYMGCYVGVSYDLESYRDCTPAYASRVIENAMFVRCVDQFGETLNLDEEAANDANTQGGTSSAVSVRAASGWLLALLLATAAWQH
jgi:hypothetical protein